MIEELPDDPLEQVEMLKGMLCDVATGGSLDDGEYRELRSRLISRYSRELIPKLLRTRRGGREVWSYLKEIASGTGSYEARRNYIVDEFAPLLEHIEGVSELPADSDISETLFEFDVSNVHATWQKALQRRSSDPEGAITAARTLLEAVCKHILDSEEETYSDRDDLPKLYKLTARVLNLSPSQHAEQVFVSILQGCSTVVQNLGTLRNKIGDAHGQGSKQPKPAPRHAALAVNLAGSMATFLVETWQVRQP